MNSGNKTISEIAAIAERFSLFRGCTSAECRELVRKLKVRMKSFEAGEIVGMVGDRLLFGIVVSGSISVFEYGLLEDRRILIARFGTGRTFGTISAGQDCAMLPWTIEAIAKSTVLMIDVEAMRKILRQGAYPRFLSNFVSASCKVGEYLAHRVMVLSNYEVADRVMMYLKWRSEKLSVKSVTFNYPQLAEFLGVNRTALYRAIAKLRNSRRIRVVGNLIYML